MEAEKEEGEEEERSWKRWRAKKEVMKSGMGEEEEKEGKEE